MRWWDLVAQRTRYPWIPMERDAKDDWRVEMSLLCGLIGVGALILAIGAALFGATEVAIWALVVAIPSIAAAQFLLPADMRF